MMLCGELAGWLAGQPAKKSEKGVDNKTVKLVGQLKRQARATADRWVTTNVSNPKNPIQTNPIKFPPPPP